MSSRTAMLIFLVLGYAFSVAAFVKAAETQPAACIVTCIDPHPACSESAKVIGLLETFLHDYVDGKLSECADLMDEHCTTFDDATKKLIVGKEAILAHMKQKWAEHAPTSSAPLRSYTITKPYAQVSGNQATVSYLAVKIYGGEHPAKLESHTTNVYAKHGDHWLLTHYRSSWKRVS